VYGGHIPFFAHGGGSRGGR